MCVANCANKMEMLKQSAEAQLPQYGMWGPHLGGEGWGKRKEDGVGWGRGTYSTKRLYQLLSDLTVTRWMMICVSGFNG